MCLCSTCTIMYISLDVFAGHEYALFWGMLLCVLVCTIWCRNSAPARVYIRISEYIVNVHNSIRNSLKIVNLSLCREISSPQINSSRIVRFHTHVQVCSEILSNDPYVCSNSRRQLNRDPITFFQTIDVSVWLVYSIMSSTHVHVSKITGTGSEKTTLPDNYSSESLNLATTGGNEVGCPFKQTNTVSLV